MHNMHAGLSQVLDVQLMAPRWNAAAQGRALHSFRRGRRRRQRVALAWWRLVRRPVSV
jgi:hypothetical protein